MTAEETNDIEDLLRHAARLGISLPDARSAAPTLGCFGHKLPVPFDWFCRHGPQHSGFPHHVWAPPMGLLSLWGKPSDLECRNAQVREWEPGWPAHWVAFWHGSDGDYCFAYDEGGHPWVVYWVYNTLNSEFAEVHFEVDYEHASFVDWFAGQVDWALALNRLGTAGLIAARQRAYAATGKAQALYAKVEAHCPKTVLAQLDGLDPLLKCPCCGVRLKAVRWRVALDDPQYGEVVAASRGWRVGAEGGPLPRPAATTYAPAPAAALSPERGAGVGATPGSGAQSAD